VARRNPVVPVTLLAGEEVRKGQGSPRLGSWPELGSGCTGERARRRQAAVAAGARAPAKR
jgi:hypothetical protein